MKGFYLMLCTIFLWMSVGSDAYAQEERRFIRQGNRHFENQELDKSEEAYRKALEKESNSFIAGFNLGDVLYEQENYEEAIKQFYSLSNITDDKEQLAKVFHNLGNTLLKEKQLEQSVEAYKQALRNNPGDMDTKHNLAYAQRLLKQQQQQQQQQQDQKKDQQNEQDQKKEQDQSQQGQEQGQDQKKQQQQQQQQQEQKMSKEDAERILQSLEENEKALQKKIKEKKSRANRQKSDKDW